MVVTSEQFLTHYADCELHITEIAHAGSVLGGAGGVESKLKPVRIS